MPCAKALFDFFGVLLFKRVDVTMKGFPDRSGTVSAENITDMTHLSYCYSSTISVHLDTKVSQGHLFIQVKSLSPLHLQGTVDRFMVFLQSF